jgi:hypothetical protein
MEAIKELVSQVAAEAKLTPASARKVIYLMTLAKDGATVARAAQAMTVVEKTVQGWCRKFDITLADYDPYPLDRFPVRPKPPHVLKVHDARTGAPLFGAREKRGPCVKQGHPVRSTVAGKEYCCDCGREIKPKKAAR